MAMPQKYDTPIKITAPVFADAGNGNEITGYESITGEHYIWARKEDVRPSRNESIRNGLEIAASRTIIWVPFRDDVDSSMRVEMSGKEYSIVGEPAEVGRRVELEIALEHRTS